jgi:hypothetical protein
MGSRGTTCEELGRNSVSWINLAQTLKQWRLVVNAVISIRVPYNVGSLRLRL